MMSLEALQKQNPRLRIYDVKDPAFAAYGRVIEGIDTTAINQAAEQIPMPKVGSVYHATEAAFEALPIAAWAQEEIFGTLPAQMGYCYGYNDTLNATEWHFCSELNIALTPLVLILGQRSDIKNGKLDSADMKAFYLPAGTVVEVYATTLHYCPCQVENGGFRCVVGLCKETNTNLDQPATDALLFRKNKWILAHEEHTELLEKGVVGGIYGENYKICF